METKTVSSEPIKKKRFAWKIWFVTALVTSLILFIGYTWFVLHWGYSTGERAGYVQKLSKKGFVVKTWEGELAMVSIPGTLPEMFSFTVRADPVAAAINNSLGKRVKLTYEQHIGVPTTLFGETQYYVTKVELAE
jgi:hypothetical protein